MRKTSLARLGKPRKAWQGLACECASHVRERDKPRARREGKREKGKKEEERSTEVSCFRDPWDFESGTLADGNFD